MLSLPLSRRNGKEGRSRVKLRKSNRTTKALLPRLVRILLASLLFPATIKSSSVCVPISLVDLLDWFAQNVKGESFKCRIMKCSLGAAVYPIWRERNLQVF
ncbi:uncharacterized protein LOC131333345 [Rhododendron vialii]|uniref:uncharacterized protein LOC131333345 n=1 Tax=Rhododendron vialii TaxID=182163 RepID=UPI00265F4BA9|nr:uncharacterized protein LOC131333345 [Rhododendron vialii]